MCSLGIFSPYTFTQLWTTKKKKYNAAADFRNLEFIISHALTFSVLGTV
jgi:hypothetical protein